MMEYRFTSPLARNYCIGELVVENQGSGISQVHSSVRMDIFKTKRAVPVAQEAVQTLPSPKCLILLITGHKTHETVRGTLVNRWCMLPAFSFPETQISFFVVKT